ncbi:MAG: M28 family peptidase [Planctomycetota bacterium]
MDRFLTLAVGALLAPLPSLLAQETSESAVPETQGPMVDLPEDRAAGVESVSLEDVREWLGYLAGPECEGRGTGQKGYQVAAEYVREHFRSLGYEPGAGEDYLQVVPWNRTAVADGDQGLFFGEGDDAMKILVGGGLKGWATAAFDFSGPLSVVTTESPREWEPAEGSLEGRAVLLATSADLTEIEFRGRVRKDPRFVSRSLQNLRQKIDEAGGRLVAVASEVAYEHADSFSERTSAARRTNRASAGAALQPVVPVIDMDMLAQVTEAAGIQLPDLGGESRSDAELKVRASIEVTTEQAPAFNVCAILPGSDPQLRDEYVVIGSHLDHLGKRGDTIYFGADDDGSGSTGLMAVAKAFAQNPVRPKRSILLLAFCGEENGLIGSRYYSDNPTVPLESMVAELQMDMIGRNEEGRQAGNETADENLNCLHLVGTQKLSNDLHALCMRLNEDRNNFAIEFDEEGVYSRSDHFNFARFGVPIAFFFTGFHPQYHQPDDTPDKIDYPKLLRIATYVYDIAFELAQQDSRPLIDPELWDQMGRLKASEDPAAPVRKN